MTHSLAQLVANHTTLTYYYQQLLLTPLLSRTTATFERRPSMGCRCKPNSLAPLKEGSRRQCITFCWTNRRLTSVGITAALTCIPSCLWPTSLLQVYFTDRGEIIWLYGRCMFQSYWKMIVINVIIKVYATAIHLVRWSNQLRQDYTPHLREITIFSNPLLCTHPITKQREGKVRKIWGRDQRRWRQSVGFFGNRRSQEADENRLASCRYTDLLFNKEKVSKCCFDLDVHPCSRHIQSFGCQIGRKGLLLRWWVSRTTFTHCTFASTQFICIFW